jgi:hypothetical protein
MPLAHPLHSDPRDKHCSAVIVNPVFTMEPVEVPRSALPDVNSIQTRRHRSFPTN